MIPIERSVANRTTNNTGDLLDQLALAAPRAVAFIAADGRSLTNLDWSVASSRGADRLAETGLRRSDRVGLAFSNATWLEYAVAYFAVQKAGGVAVPIPGYLQSAQMAALAEELGLSTVLGPVCSSLREDLPELVAPFFDLNELGAETRDAATAPTTNRPAKSDLAEILYTSGSTGVPKAVASRHGLFVERYDGWAKDGRPDEHLVKLNVLPFGTNASQCSLFAPLDISRVRYRGDDRTVGWTVLVAEGFDAASFVSMVETHGVAATVLVPTMIAALLSRLGTDHDALRPLLFLETATAPLAPAVAERVSEALPWVSLQDCYSSTEAWPACTIAEYGGSPPGSVGTPVGRTRVRIAAPDGSQVGAGEWGDVLMCVEGFEFRRTYVSQDTSNVFRGDWVATGDIGYLDDDGNLFVVDRSVDLINMGGYKTSSLDVEQALTTHPLVTQAAVVAIEHPTLGEYPVAAVTASSSTAATDLLQWVRRQLGPRAPRRVTIVDELPTTPAGKVDKLMLRELLSGRRDLVDEGLSSTAIRLRDLWRDVLGVASIDGATDFFEVGGDSLSAISIAGELSEALGIDVPASLMFDSATLADAARSVDDLLARADDGSRPSYG